MSKKLLLVFCVLVLGLATNALAQVPAGVDVGGPALAGSFSYDPGTDSWTVTGAGADIWGGWDQCYYVYRPLAGDGSAVAQVLSMDCTYQWSKVGVMIRETVAGDSKHMMISMTGANGVQTVWREETGGASADVRTDIALPIYLKVERVGNVFNTYMTFNPAFWIPQHSVTIDMKSDVTIGMFVGSVNSTELCSAVFNSVELVAAPYLTAWNLSPADGSQDLPLDTELSWMPGDTAASHDVYFGTSSPPEFVGNQAETSYAPALAGGKTYYYRIDEVEADGVTKHAGQELSFTTLSLGPGKVLYEYWAGIGGVAVADLTSNPAYPDSPSGSQYIDNFEGPSGWADNYGCRLSGWLHAPASGDYTFWIASDDASQLWLSTTDNPADAQMLCEEPACCHDYDGTPVQKSGLVSLTAGQMYYIHALMKEGGGGDWVRVAWQIPGYSRDLLTGTYVSPAAVRPLEAYAPLPADGAEMVPIDATLSWLAGETSASLDVYFGTESPPPLVGNQAGTGYDPGILAGGTVYYWKVDAVEADGVTVHPGAVWSFKTTRPGVGSILREVWEGIGGTIVSDLTNNANYPTNPTWSDEIPSFNVTDFADNFGSRIHGWLMPETSGEYTFWISSDDSSDLWLSTSERPADAVRIAYVDGWTCNQCWDWQANQNSTNVVGGTIPLEGGQMYYISALYKEGGGGDNCGVGWQGPDSPSLSIIDGYYLLPFQNLWAWHPSPADGATGVDITPTLSWQPAVDAVSYEVYVDDVLLAETTGTSVEAGPFVLSDALHPSTHTWRVDVVTNSPVRTGVTWGFTVSDSLLIDDFEAYDVVPEPIAPQMVVGGDYTIEAVPAPEQTVVGGDYEIPGYTVEAVAPDAGCLIAHWAFEGDYTDSSGSGFDGTPVGDASIVTDPDRGQVLSLDGDLDYVNCGNPAALNFGTGDWSLSAWVKNTMTGTGDANKGAIVANGGDTGGGHRFCLILSEEEEGEVTLVVDDDATKVQARGDATQVNDDVWHHVLGVREGDTITIYIDGVVEGSAGLPAGYDLSGTVQHDVLIGAITDAPDPDAIYKDYGGLIDDVQIYNCALTEGNARHLAGIGDKVIDPVYVPPIYGPLALHLEFEGDATDSSGNGRDGTLMGDAQFEAGAVGQALLLDGDGDYVNVDGYKGINAIDGVQQPFTVANWFKIAPGASDGNVEMVTWGTSAGQQRLTWRVHQGRLRTEHASGNLRGNTYVDDGEWHHGALVVTEGANLRPDVTKLYVDGVEDTTFSGSDNPYNLTANVDVRIGMSGPQNGRYWPGSIDDVRIYDYTLSEGEIRYLAGVGDRYVPPVIGPMRLHLEFEGDLTDSSGNGNDGTAVGAIAFETDPVMGQVLSLPGGDDQYVAVPPVGLSGNDQTTIACWAKADHTSIPDWSLIFGFTGTADGSGGSGSHFNIGSLGGPGGVGAHVWNWEETMFSDTEALEWHHYAMTYDGTTIAYFGDGKYMDTDPGKSNVMDLSARADRVHVGSRITQTSSFPGKVDDARVYDYVLTDGQIAAIAGATAANPISDTWSEMGLVESILDAGSMRMDTYGWPGLSYYAGEVSRAMPVADLTAPGGKSLSIWLSGDPGNVAGLMYASLTDGDGQSAYAAYDGDLTDADWQQWNVDLAEFVGVDMTNAAEIAIGLAGLDGGIKADIMNVDDIRVYSGRCFPGLKKPAYDLNDDCIVDSADLQVMKGQWGRQILTQDYEERAAYWDERYPFNWGGDGVAMRDGLVAAGYTVLDADQLKTWMDERIADGKVSVVVICRDSAPDTVAETMDANCTLRRYLDAGGKVVWYADIPFYYQGHSDGTQTTWGGDGQVNILGIGGVDRWDSYETANITDIGAAWGLTQTWTSQRANNPDGLTVLATDSQGFALAYVKHYVPGDAARGFVRLWDQGGGTTPPVEDVISAAEAKGYISADLNGDGAVGWMDVILMLRNWLDEELWP